MTNPKHNKTTSMTKKIRTTIILTLLFMCQNIMAQNKTSTNDSPSQTDLGIFALPPFERAVRCIKYYEGWHDIKRNYPYIGWGHRILPHEKFKKNLTYRQADSLLRSDLRKLCTLFRKYSKDSLLLAVLAYNVGPYKILGNRRFPKSRLLHMIEQGRRDIRQEYLDFCRYQRCKMASIRRRRQTELLLLYQTHIARK